jgi:septum formation protein
MLQEAGFDPRRAEFDVDDDSLVEAVGGVEAACLARAWFKVCAAISVLAAGDDVHAASGVVLAADTLCESEGRLVGKPSNADEARRMIRSLSDCEHRTLTGVAIIDLHDDLRSIWSDSTRVRIGHLQDEEIDAYVATGAWQGKSGGYNLSDRIEAGWPIRIEGDPTTVMGLPMRRLVPQLRSLLSKGLM